MILSQSVNSFRAQWMYRRLPAGDAMLQARRGLSPAFLNLLEAVDGDAPVSFVALEARFPQQDADDLELWLAELCRMELIAPAQQTAAPATATVTAPAPAAGALPTVLLVHKLPSTRLAWRDLLTHLPVQLHEAGTLEEADAAYNRLSPAAVVIGPEGSDFNALNLIHVLKHPRAPRLTKVFLVLDERAWSPKIKAAAARADDTVAPEAWNSLAERVASQLSLPKAAQAEAFDPMQMDAEAATDLRAGLEQEHPRVAAEIAHLWGQGGLDALFDQWLFDDGEQAEFSPQAMEDLLFLYRLHGELRQHEHAWRAAPLPRGRRAHPATLKATGRHRALAPGAQRAA